MFDNITEALESAVLTKGVCLNESNYIATYENDLSSPSGVSCSGLFPATRSNLSEVDVFLGSASYLVKEGLKENPKIKSF